MYIVIEKFGMPTIVTDEDGNVKNFTYRKDAQAEADDCQDGIVVDLDKMEEDVDGPWVNCTFTSVWSSGLELTTDCKYNPATGEVVPTGCEANVASDEILEEEFITLEDKSTIPVCLECHTHTRPTSMVPDGTGHGLHEEKKCRNEECDSNN
jgi:hypothetical protein